MPYKDKEQLKAYQKRYREAHKEKARAAGVEWRKKNPGYMTEYMRGYVIKQILKGE